MKKIKEGLGFAIYQREQADEPVPAPPGWATAACGGRYEYVVTYDPRRIRVERLTARESSAYKRGELTVEGTVHAELPASVHGWWKIAKRQLCLVIDANAKLTERSPERT